MPNSQVNPYQAPQAVVRDTGQGASTGQLAGRGIRLAAVLLDGLFMGLAMIPMVIGFGMDPEMEGVGLGLLILGMVMGLGLFIYNLILLSQNGWTLGKKVCSIRIVRSDGSEAGLARLFWLRIFVNGLIGGIPIVGAFYSLIDPLFIFKEDRRCVHDLIADTMVIEA